MKTFKKFYYEEAKRICAWCRKPLVKGNQTDPEAKPYSKGDPEYSSGTHGICDKCVSKIEDQEVNEMAPPTVPTMTRIPDGLAVPKVNPETLQNNVVKGYERSKQINMLKKKLNELKAQKNNDSDQELEEEILRIEGMIERMA